MSRPTTTSRPEAPKDDPFPRFWDERPVNPLGSPERRSDALAEYQSAIRRHGADLVNDALTAFVCAERTRELPRHLSTLLEDDQLLRSYADQARYVPSPDQERAFDLCWIAYGGEPIRDDRDRAAKIAHFNRLVDDPLAFYAAIREYLRQCRRDEIEARYRFGWSTFVAGQWREINYGGELARLMCEAAGVGAPAQTSIEAARSGLAERNGWTRWGRHCESDIEAREGFRWGRSCDEVTATYARAHVFCDSAFECSEEPSWIAHQIERDERAPDEIERATWEHLARLRLVPQMELPDDDRGSG